jgi:hypothetical protein
MLTPEMIYALLKAQQKDVCLRHGLPQRRISSPAISRTPMVCMNGRVSGPTSVRRRVWLVCATRRGSLIAQGRLCSGSFVAKENLCSYL